MNSNCIAMACICSYCAAQQNSTHTVCLAQVGTHFCGAFLKIYFHCRYMYTFDELACAMTLYTMQIQFSDVSVLSDHLTGNRQSSIYSST